MPASAARAVRRLHQPLPPQLPLLYPPAPSKLTQHQVAYCVLAFINTPPLLLHVVIVMSNKVRLHSSCMHEYASLYMCMRRV